MNKSSMLTECNYVGRILQFLDYFREKLKEQ